EAAKVGATEVDVRMDSKLVVEQMSGRWKVKNADLKDLVAEAKSLAAKFDRVTYTWVPRADNSHADRLANEAMDAAAAESDPPQAEQNTDRPAHAAVSPAGWVGARGAPT